VEEIISFIVQVVLEVGLQLFGSLGLDVTTTPRGDRKGGCGLYLAFGVFGAVCGGISLIFAPDAIIPDSTLRIANLFVAPVVAGWLSYVVARYLWSGRGEEAGEHFWRGFWFAMFFGLVRFAYINR
jgi:hypothetical protein